jgi:hypothetical protein
LRPIPKDSDEKVNANKRVKKEEEKSKVIQEEVKSNPRRNEN